MLYRVEIWDTARSVPTINLLVHTIVVFADDVFCEWYANYIVTVALF